MSKRTFIRTPDGKKMVLEESLNGTVTMRPATEDDLANATVRADALHMVQGVSPGERMIVKNLAATPEAAKRYLRSLGYQVANVQNPGLSGFNFAVRREDGDPWKVVDPDGFFNNGGGVDIQDFTDLISEAVLGISTAVGFGAGGPLGAGAAGLGTEALRQAIGSAVVPGNFDPVGLGVEAGAAALAGPVGDAAGWVGRKVISGGIKAAQAGGRVGLTLGARVMSIPQGMAPHLAAEDALTYVARGGGRSLPELSMGGRMMRRVVDFVRQNPNSMPARQLASGILDDVAQTPAGRVSLAKPISYLERLALRETGEVAERTTEREVIQQTEREFSRSATGESRRVGRTISTGNKGTTETPFDRTTILEEGTEAVGETAAEATTKTRRTVREAKIGPTNVDAARMRFHERALPRKAVETVDDLKALMVQMGAPDLDNIPVTVAARIQKELMDKATDMGANATQPEFSRLAKEIREAGNMVKEIVNSAADSTGVRRTFRGRDVLYSELREYVDQQTRALKSMSKHVGLDRFPDPEMNDGVGIATRFVSSLYSPSRGAYRSALRDFSRLFDLPYEWVEGVARKPVIGNMVKSKAGFGIPATLPRFTAAGKFLGPSLFLGAPVLGGATGGPEGAALGTGLAAAGLFLASPRTIVNLTRRGMRAGARLAALDAQIKSATVNPALRAALVQTLRESGTIAAELIRSGETVGTQNIVNEQGKRKGKPAVLTGL